MAIVAETKGFDVKTRVCDYTKWSIITGSKTESGRFKHACCPAADKTPQCVAL